MISTLKVGGSSPTTLESIAFNDLANLSEEELRDSHLDFNTILSDLSNSANTSDATVPTPYDLHGLNCRYWDTNNLANVVSSAEFDLFVHLNIQCLSAKFDGLIAFLDELSHKKNEKLPTVLALSETWLNEHNDSTFAINGYQPIVSNFRLDNSSRGGVALFVRSGHEYIKRPDLNKFVPFIFESVFVTLTEPRLTVGVVYTSPSADTAAFLDEYKNTLNSLMQLNENFILLGDFNTDLLKYMQDSSVTEFVDSNFELGCLPLITKPTRITDTSASCLDNIITNKIYPASEAGVLIEDISDHLPVFYSIPNSHHKNQTYNTNHSFPRRNFSKQNLCKLNLSLAQRSWEEILSEEDPNIASTTFKNILENELNTHCPVQTPSHNAKQPNQPWFTQGLKISSRKKKKLYKKSLKNPNRVETYRKYRNLFNKLIKLAKSNYYSNLLDQHKHDIRKTWSVLRESIFKTKAEKTIPTKLKCSQTDSFSTELNDPIQIADYFNALFASVGARTTSSINNSDAVNPLEFMKHVNVKETFFVLPTDETEVISTCLSIKSKQSCGYDDISNIVTKSIIYNISKPLAHIYNSSFNTGIFPDLFNISKIIPIYKNGDKCNAANYRPISLLTSFSKILEKLMCKRLTKFISKHDIFFTKQYGFIKGRSTEHAMLDILYKIIESIENKEFALGTFLDLSKAFDTISHQTLLNKLSVYGIRGVALNWFTTYLSNRIQFVDTGSARSSFLPVTSGVPQGSILGPLLFLLYINDMPSCSQILTYTLFADDTTALSTSPSIETLFSTTNNELKSLHAWFSSNSLQINANKTNVVLFTTRQREPHLDLQNTPLNLNLSGTDLNLSPSVKFLGLQLDKNLTFKPHLDYISKKLSKSIYALRRAAKVLPLKDLKTLYSALILPYLNYGLLAWGGACKAESYLLKLHRGQEVNSKHFLHPVHKLQKRALRIIAKAGVHAHHIPLCQSLDILDLVDLYSVKALSFFHDYFHGKLPPFFLNKFNLYYSRDDSLLIKTNFRRTDIASSSIFNTLTNVWNPLPHDLKLQISKSKKTFLSKVKNYFLSKYQDWECKTPNCFVCAK